MTSRATEDMQAHGQWSCNHMSCFLCPGDCCQSPFRTRWFARAAGLWWNTHKQDWMIGWSKRGTRKGFWSKIRSHPVRPAPHKVLKKVRPDKMHMRMLANFLDSETVATCVLVLPHSASTSECYLCSCTSSFSQQLRSVGTRAGGPGGCNFQLAN